MNRIFISLKPEFAKLIKEQRKTYEFRKYRPKKSVQGLIIYVTQPTAKLKYITKTKVPTEYPETIPENGIGNKEFNQGKKKSKYAFPILELRELNNPIPLKVLQRKFGFHPPESFIYGDTYPDLVEFLQEQETKKVF